MESYDVVIVGGGVGGLTLGCRLSGKGHRVCILEARSQLKPSKRGLGLQPNGLAALENLALLAEVTKIGVRCRYANTFDVGRNLLARIDYSLLEGAQSYYLLVVPSQLELVLRRNFAEGGGVLYESATFLDFIKNDEGLEVQVQRGPSTIELGANVLVGADGENSRVRKAIDVSVSVKQYSDHYIATLVGSLKSLRDKEEGRLYIGRGQAMGLFPVPDGAYLFYFTGTRDFEEFKSRGLDHLKTEVADIEPEVSDALGSLNSWEDTLYVVPKRVRAGSWVADRVALIGDAAHALNPSLGQGANTTLQDVVALSETLEKSLSSGNFNLAALKAYEYSRRAHTRFIQDQSERMARISATKNPFYSWACNRFFKKAGKDAELKRIVLRLAAGQIDRLSLHDMGRFFI
jgi:2-polyprenyl-6-methoxyphenol hydroxylase-like FAD-dependent oxidoreductase